MDHIENTVHSCIPVISMGMCLFARALTSNSCMYLLIKNLFLQVNVASLLISRSWNNECACYTIISVVVMVVVVAAAAVEAAVVINLNYCEAISVGKHSSKLTEIENELKLLPSSSFVMVVVAIIISVNVWN
jgi:hypothetical protein